MPLTDDHSKLRFEKHLRDADRRKWRADVRQAIGASLRRSLWTAVIVVPTTAVIGTATSTGIIGVGLLAGLSVMPFIFALPHLFARSNFASTARWVDGLLPGHSPVALALALHQNDDATPFAQATISDGVRAIEGAPFPSVSHRPTLSNFIKPSAVLAVEAIAILAVTLASPRTVLAGLTGFIADRKSQSTYTAETTQKSPDGMRGGHNARPGVVSSDFAADMNTLTALHGRMAAGGKPGRGNHQNGSIGFANHDSSPQSGTSDSSRVQSAATAPPASANKSESKSESGSSSAPPSSDAEQQTRPQAAPPADSPTAEEQPPDSGSSNDSTPPPQADNRPNERGQATGSALPKKSRGVAPLLLETRLPDVFEGRRLPGDASRQTFNADAPALPASIDQDARQSINPAHGSERPGERYAVPADMRDRVTDYFTAYRKSVESH